MKYLSQQDVENYNRDGYVLVENLFSRSEVDLLLDTIAGGGQLPGETRATTDAQGRKAGIAIWHKLEDDIWGAVSTNPRLVNNIRVLMGEEIAFFHGKVMLKMAQSGGAWEWHQDYGYWYNQGFAFPRMMSAFVALDPATQENGCLQILKGSHKLGRLEHGVVGDQTGADIERLERLEPFFERIPCEMTPGSVLFFHCNLLHTSAPNNSPFPRRSFIICYNALSNPQINRRKLCSETVCPVSNDDAILTFSRQPALVGA
jgi:ectoine hydroxylase